jgi:hypothetical protein
MYSLGVPTTTISYGLSLLESSSKSCTIAFHRSTRSCCWSEKESSASC